jgi:hypothetical protein
LSALSLSLLVPADAFAGDAFIPAPSSAPDPSYCSALGDGFFAVAGSSACIKISGYVSAGTEFSVPGAQGIGGSSFATKSNLGMDSQSAVSAETQFETPLGPGRVYVQVGHNSYGQ